MERKGYWVWAAILLPVSVSVGLNAVGIHATQVIALEGPLVAEGATMERSNPVFHGIMLASFVGSAVLMYVGMAGFDEVKSSIGWWRHVMAVGTALFYLPVLWYAWERRKVASRDPTEG